MLIVACPCILARRYALFRIPQNNLHKRLIQPLTPAKAYSLTKPMNMVTRWVYLRRGETVALPYVSAFAVDRRSKEVSPCAECYCDIHGARMYVEFPSTLQILFVFIYFGLAAANHPEVDDKGAVVTRASLHQK